MSADVSNSARTIENVRHELKKWEWEFKQANGRKPGRDDVKNDAIISAKYEEYDKLSGRGLKGRASEKLGGDNEGKPDSRVLKERSANLVSATPKKMVKHTSSISMEEPDAAAEQEEQPTPACVRFALGPTPQKDGAILGLFDMLPSGTPSKAGSAPFEEVEAVVNATPSKSAPLCPTNVNGSVTPQSSAKRYYLDAFRSTPLKRKREDETSTPSTTKRQYATPAFLRRSHTLPTIGEDGEEPAAIAAAPFGKRGLVRSLSAIIHGLRRQEEKKMDDEWDVLNEIEAEERGETVRPSAPKVLVEDSQAVEMPLGPDRGLESEDDADGDVDGNTVDANGRVRKPWKKKGLKRQTRRVIMRPVLHKAKKAVDYAHSDNEDGSQSEQEAQERSQKDERPTAEPLDLEDYNSHDDAENAPDRQRSKRSEKKSKKKSAKSTDDMRGDGEGQGKKTKKATLAHTNFRKLKIKNKNSKANGRGRKFGRR